MEAAKMRLDDNGCPVTEPDEISAKECPPNPCRFCTGMSALRKSNSEYMTSWEWCQEMKTCAATVDWDAVYGHGGS